MKKITLILLTCVALFSVAQEAKAGLNIGLYFGAPVRYYRSYDEGCHTRYSRNVRYYREPDYYVPSRRVVRYYSEPVYYRSSRYYGRGCR